ncbi:uncharacterized protein LOC112052438 [Bicyclus anynana]|uniref:Uncharacterized protein LOC112052438 n=1 Tax=Bicyclus anynana TaxID=110368 RepID=A0A6J1NQY4_BICAN|nr:uncharacterized protein LOC112052438 [Bicyclus anynana]
MAKTACTTSVTIILFITVHLTATAKQNPRPVFESNNEQERIDDSVRLSNNPGYLPFGNPLAGNSIQNARIHRNNQQAMFNAERIRQHKAQLQRWSKGPQIIDSYMKAYHDSQENHQLTLENQQATLKDGPVTAAPVRILGRPVKQRNVQKKRVPNLENTGNIAQIDCLSGTNRGQLPKRGDIKFFQGSEPTKITKADAVIKDVRNRNHRSYGSSDYHQNLETKRYKTVYASPAPSYEHGVTIKPNGNAGIAQPSELASLYTSAVPSDAKYAYPNNVNSLKSVQDIQALNSLLHKSPTEQLTEFNALLNNGKIPEDITKGVPVDFYFYLKDPTQHGIAQNYDNLKYTQIPQTYASAFAPDHVTKDYTPITEDVDDIEDPNKGPVTFNLQPIPPTKIPEQTTTTKSNNYYKVEVASQTISAGLKPKHIKEEYYVKQENDPHYESLTYGYQPIYVDGGDSKSEMYLHHNAEPTGVQHLLEDGTQTSAFGDDNLHYAANYDFGYRVHDKDSGNYFGHREAKQGKSTKGTYHVLLPDGRMQLVNYSAGPSGFHADISYDHMQ